MHKRQVERLHQQLRERGTSCVVTRVYFKGARVKAEIAIARGRKLHDKRQALKTKQAKREMRHSR